MNKRIVIMSASVAMLAVSVFACTVSLNDMMQDTDWSMFGEFSIGDRTVTTYDGYIDGDYYVVKCPKDTIEMDCRVIPPADSSSFMRLSRSRQIEDIVRRRFPLDEKEKARITSGIILLRRYNLSYLSVTTDTVTVVTETGDTLNMPL